MKILIEDLQDKIKLDDNIKELINSAVTLSLESENVIIDSQVSIYFVDNDIIQKSGSWYSYDESKLGQGKQAVIDILQDNPELLEEIEAQVISTINNRGINKIDELFE